MKPNFSKKFIKWLVAPIGLALCLAPIAVSALPWGVAEPTYAVSAPAPTVISRSATADEYQAMSDHLSTLGLTGPQHNVLWARLGSDLLPLLEQGAVPADRLSWLALSNYSSDLADRYTEYQALHPELPHDQVVLAVNMDLDRPFYSTIEEISDPDSPFVLVNKSHALRRDYVPTLEALGTGYGAGSLRPEAARQFRAMADAAWLDGVTLYSVSAYRSYATQTATYNRYLTQYSQQTVDEFSARPGHSEHQTGLALDINVAQTSAHFEQTEEYAWLVEHCADFGFILRYPQGKEFITGYRFEPWHYRYVGYEIAHLCMEQGLTYEEYIALQPDEELDTVPTLVYQDQILDMEQNTLVFNGTWYVSAETLAHHVGWACGELSEGNDLVLYGSNCRLVLYPGLRCQRDGSVVRLTAPALSLNGTLYLSLADLCSLMNLSGKSIPLGLELLHYQLL